MKEIKTDRSFECIVESYHKLIYKICIDILHDPFEAENISQEAFLSLYKNFYKYSDLGDNELKNLLCRITINKCKDYIKSSHFKLVANSFDFLELKDLKDSKTSSLENIIKMEQNSRIRKVVEELKNPYKEVVIEYFFNELSLDEISEKLKRDKAVIKTQLYRSKKILKSSLKGGDSIG
ncbi:MAG: sigma-70 family RNA polymerase sigma factor [Clostridia bacterium]|nr:sigma-70 family RNA polymerase sigma factor [Clostridia bacterium]MDD4375634.1 sigma-70 family RNA polymerase sigma factor [Clostridia bacterium]